MRPHDIAQLATNPPRMPASQPQEPPEQKTTTDTARANNGKNGA